MATASPTRERDDTDELELAEHRDQAGQLSASLDRPDQNARGGQPRRAGAKEPAGPIQEPNRRLVVELNTRTANDLAWLVDTEEMNKTNLVNRAVQVYRLVIEAQQNGGGMTIDDPARGAPERIRVV